MTTGSSAEDGSCQWEVGVLPGPHADPDFVTSEFAEVFHTTPYQVHYNSNRWAPPCSMVFIYLHASIVRVCMCVRGVFGVGFGGRESR